MRKAIIGYALPLLAVLVLGPLATLPLAATRGIDASGAHTALLGSAPAMGVIGWLLATGAAVGVAWLGSRAIGPKEGWFAGALILLWAAWRTGSARELVLSGGFAGAPLVIEGVLALASAGLVAVVAATHGRRIAEFVRETFSPTALVPIGVAALVGVVGATLAAREVSKGQAIFAAAAAGVLAGSAARLLGGEESDEVAAVRAIVGACLIAVVAPIYTAVAQDPEAMLMAGRSLGIGSILPMDWTTGVLLGVPIGISWAGSSSARHGT